MKSADHLKIKGLATESATREDTQPRHDVIMSGHDEEEEEKRRSIIHASIGGTKGRKGYLPKKIRTSGDRISDSSSPQCLSDPGIVGSPMSATGSSGTSGSLGAVPRRRNSGLAPISEFPAAASSPEVDQGQTGKTDQELEEGKSDP